MRDHGLKIELVEEESIAGELGLEPGDRVLWINGNEVRDILDYRFFTADEELEILVQKESGEQWLLEIEKYADEQLGISFLGGGWGNTRSCGNKCVFCFVDQMPGEMRPSLYVKDDDYRLSFAQGNFITLTNVSEAELERIAGMRLSPLYVSVHTTNPQLRREMMGHPRAGKIMEQLIYLAEAGIEIHAQAVLCPGINDGLELDRTIGDLGNLRPSISSMAVVPVGLTGHRSGLNELRSYNKSEARTVLEQVHRWQEKFLQSYDYPLVFAGDEFYLLAGVPVPPAEKYGGFPQTENGVGLVRLFMDEWAGARKLLPGSLKRPLKCSVVTGTLAGPVLQPVVEELNQVSGLQVSLQVLENRFFGKTVTVAGLLTGQDLLNGLAGLDIGEKLFIPSVMLRRDESVFLDDLTPDELSGRLGVQVVIVAGPEDLIKKINLNNNP